MSQTGSILIKNIFSSEKFGTSIFLVQLAGPDSWEFLQKFLIATQHEESVGKQKICPENRIEPWSLFRYQCDEFANLRVYKDDPEEETWELVAQTHDEFKQLIQQLQNGPTFVKGEKPEQPEIPMEEDSMTDYNEIIRDTGPVRSIGTSNATSLAPSDDEDQVKLSRGEICVANFRPPCDCCLFGELNIYPPASEARRGVYWKWA